MEGNGRNLGRHLRGKMKRDYLGLLEERKELRNKAIERELFLKETVSFPFFPICFNFPSQFFLGVSIKLETKLKSADLEIV